MRERAFRREIISALMIMANLPWVDEPSFQFIRYGAVRIDPHQQATAQHRDQRLSSRQAKERRQTGRAVAAQAVQVNLSSMSDSLTSSAQPSALVST